jgi:hypothetical protein
MKLIFILTQFSLDIYQEVVSLDNLILNISNFGEYLSLAEVFEDSWQKIEKYTEIATLIQFFVEDKAGFTNTRIVAIWCRTWSLFSGKPFEIYKNNTLVDSIIYSSEPRLG